MNESRTHGAALCDALHARFGERLAIPAGLRGLEELLAIARHGSQREWASDPVAPELTRLLAACALSAPTKSDLQQASIIDVRSATLRDRLAALTPALPWVRLAPSFVVFCGDGRRLRAAFARRGQVFANEHLDQFFNATVDASLVMMNFMRAASAAGLAHCAVSLIRDHPRTLDDLLELPGHVFPVAGLCLGYPVKAASVRTRLPLSLTFHVNGYQDDPGGELLTEHERRCEAARPQAPTWSGSVVSRYEQVQRADWGEYVRAKGFSLR